MFKHIKQQVNDNFQRLLLAEQLFYVSIDRDEVWSKYIDAFSDETKQSHNCNCCKSFLRQYAGIVAIIGGKRVSIWDNIDADDDYKASITNLQVYINSLPVTDVFLNEFSSCGTDMNYDAKNDVNWEHFHIDLPAKYVNKRDIDAVRGMKRTAKETFARAARELTTEATETVIDLINQGSIYRGNEFKALLEQFLKIQRNVKSYLDSPAMLSVNQVNDYFWSTSQSTPASITGIRNTAIGTLLIDLSEGKIDLDGCVAKFEKVMAPANYKRPTALVTPKMVEQAKEKLTELGLMDSLERRYANETDLSVEDIIYTDKSTSITDVFGEMAKDTLVNPKTYSKVEEISIEDFINKVVPTSKSIEVLVENSHMNNFLSIVTSVVAGAKSLFKWANNFSWSYTGGITDSIKERVKQAGGNIDAVLRFSIQWNDEDTPGIVDLDAHAIEPNRFEHYYGTKGRRTNTSGMLDVDMINPSGVGIENITWTDLSKMPEGTYQFYIKNFNSNRNKGFKAQIECGGESYEFHYGKHFTGDIIVAEVRLKNGVFTVNTILEGNSSISSRIKWGVKTNQFTKVKKIMLSPNHWNGAVGNKHYMFLLENCISDETARPFFNEFLNQEFDENRKVFEIMGSKMKVEATDNQLSGIGFSETQRNHLLVRVSGTFSRVLKVNF